MKKNNYPIIGGRGFNTNSLDKRLCFEMWVDRGTALKAAKALETEHGLVGRSGKHYTEAAVGRAAKQFVLLETDTAREMWQEKFGEVDDEIWYDYLSRISKGILLPIGRNSYENWLADHPEMQEYENSLTD